MAFCSSASLASTVLTVLPSIMAAEGLLTVVTTPFVHLMSLRPADSMIWAVELGRPLDSMIWAASMRLSWALGLSGAFMVSLMPCWWPNLKGEEGFKSLI